MVDALRAAVPTLDPGEQHIALALYRVLMEGRAVSPEELAERAGVAVGAVEESLSRWPGVFRAKDGRIIGFWGLAVRGMPHRLSSDRGRVTTWCALDPLLIAPLVVPEARVDSRDPVTGEAISLTVTPHGVVDISPPSVQVSLLVPTEPFGHDIVESFCHYVHFFASEQSGVAWTNEHPGTFVIPVEEAFDVANRSWPALFEAARGSGRGGPPEAGRPG